MVAQQDHDIRHRTRALASRWTTLIAGVCVAVPGLAGVVTSIPQFDMRPLVILILLTGPA